MTELPEAVRALPDGPSYAHIATLLPDGVPPASRCRSSGWKAAGSSS